jgi:hypothetical protein
VRQRKKPARRLVRTGSSAAIRFWQQILAAANNFADGSRFQACNKKPTRRLEPTGASFLVGGNGIVSLTRARFREIADDQCAENFRDIWPAITSHNLLLAGTGNIPERATRSTASRRIRRVVASTNCTRLFASVPAGSHQLTLTLQPFQMHSNSSWSGPETSLRFDMSRPFAKRCLFLVAEVSDNF